MDHPVIITFLVIAVVAALSFAAEVFKPLALAVLLSFALAPFARRLERGGLPRPIAVVFTVILTLALLAGAGYIVGKQLATLATRLPDYQQNVAKKLHALQPKGTGPLARAGQFIADLEAQIGESKWNPNVLNVNVVSEPTYRTRLVAAVGPYLEFLSLATFVLVLVFFMLLNREDLRDRVTRLFGRRSVTLTTRTMNEAGSRISRYLGMFVLFNSAYGLVIGVGLRLIGVPFSTLWGFLAGALKFIPYVGPAAAFALPFVFSFAMAPGWAQPLEVLALFCVIEILANSFLEPMIYGRTTGLSSLGLLVAAMFWTWLWGLLGLLLSTPLTVCLAVLGKYVPSLRAFSTLLGDEAELPGDVRFYQRLLTHDLDGAIELIDCAQQQQSLSRVEIFDQILVPTLSQAGRDVAHAEIDDHELRFIWRVMRDIIDDEAGSLPADASAAHDSPPATDSLRVLGIAVNGGGDDLVLRILELLLAADQIELERVSDVESPLILAESVVADPPALIILSHLPPTGLTIARYLLRRLRSRLPDLPIVVGRWTERGEHGTGGEKLVAAGATAVVTSLAEGRDKALCLLRPAPVETPAKGLMAVG
jgi:predicted PurR-regulated permease PerM